MVFLMHPMLTYFFRLIRRVRFQVLFTTVFLVIIYILFSNQRVADLPQQKPGPVVAVKPSPPSSSKVHSEKRNPTRREPYSNETWPQANYNVHTFYYMWYGNPTHDEKWFHWNHRRLPHWNEQTDLRYSHARHIPPDDVGADYYPLLGAYSSSDPDIVDQHMYMIRAARIGVVAVSWYPPGTADEEGKPSDSLLPLILDTADKYDLKVCFHIEPFASRTVSRLKNAIQHIITNYGTHRAFYRRTHAGRALPLYYLYDSYQVNVNVWQKLFSRLSEDSVRDTPLDGVFIGLVVEAQHLTDTYNAGFDGMYTYFASNTFVYGSKPSNWYRIAAFCKQRDMLFIPSVGPGYIDVQVRPWNSINTKDRNDGAYYRQNFKMALSCDPAAVSITSFNEWHEGTQIEPAVPHNRKRGLNTQYLTYGDDSYLYMDLTKRLIEKMPGVH